MRILYLFTALFLSKFIFSQQQAQPYWQRSFGGFGSDYSVAFTKTFDKGYVITGYSYQSLDGDIDNVNQSFDYYAWLVKLDSARNMIWQRKFRRVQSAAQQVATRAVIQTKDSGIVVLVAGEDDTAPEAVVKYSKNGQFLWRYAPPGDSRPFNFSQLMENPDGTIVVCGGKQLFIGNDVARGWLVFLNPNGTLITEQLYPGFSNKALQFTTIDSSYGGGYIVGGTYDTLGGNIYLARIAADRSVTWFKNYGGHGYEVVNDIIMLPGNTYAVSSSTTSSDGDVPGNHCVGGGNCAEDAWLLKIDQSGNILNNTEYGDFDTDKGMKLVKYNNGLLMVGYSNSRLNSFSGNRGGYDVWTTQMDYSLNRLEAYGFYGGPAGDNGLDVLIDSAEGQVYPVILATTAGGATSQVEGFHDSPFLLNETDSWIFKLGRFNTIKGNAFYDYNLNGIKDGAEPYFKRGIFSSVSSTDSLSSYNTDGFFQYKVLQNSYTTRLTLNDTAYTVAPSSHAITFPNYFNTDSISFAVQIRPGFSDLSIAAYAMSSARPGTEVLYSAMLTNRSGDTARNKQVYLLKDSRLTYINATPAPLRVNGDSIIWQYTILKPSDTLQYSVRLKPGVPPVVQINDTLKSYFAAPLSTDADTTNNLAKIVQTVRGSYDPNDKNEMHNGKIPASKAAAGEFLTYVIRFQNTGNDLAYNIIVKDTLDTQLNLATLEILKTSHPCTLKMNKKQLQWVFQNIYLPDSTSNEPASHGYIIYRIKTNRNVVSNSFVYNRASIYFDYNLPVLTNTTGTLLESSVTALPDVPTFQTSIIKLYPNPAMNKVYINYSGNQTSRANIEIYTATGNLVKIISSQLLSPSAPATTEVGSLPSGVYYFRIRGKNINEAHSLMIIR